MTRSCSSCVVCTASTPYSVDSVWTKATEPLPDPTAPPLHSFRKIHARLIMGNLYTKTLT